MNFSIRIFYYQTKLEQKKIARKGQSFKMFYQLLVVFEDGGIIGIDIIVEIFIGVIDVVVD